MIEQLSESLVLLAYVRLMLACSVCCRLGTSQYRDGIAPGGAMGMSRWTEMVWALVYLRIPCSPCLLPTPGSFQPPMNASTDAQVAA